METGQTYHIYNHANGSENIFKEEENYRFFLQQYKKHLSEIVDTYAYCLMPNHFHLLIRIKSLEEFKDLPGFKNLEGLEKRISKHFSNFFNSYTKSFNKKYNRMGSLFMKNFKRKRIESVQQWQETFLYIHLNPIKHKFAKNIEKWKWSSWHAYNKMETKSLLVRSEALENFDNLENLLYCTDEKMNRILDENLE